MICLITVQTGIPVIYILMLYYRFGAFEEFKSWYAVDNVLTPDKRLLCGLGKVSCTIIMGNSVHCLILHITMNNIDMPKLDWT